MFIEPVELTEEIYQPIAKYCKENDLRLYEGELMNAKASLKHFQAAGLNSIGFVEQIYLLGEIHSRLQKEQIEALPETERAAAISRVQGFKEAEETKRKEDAEAEQARLREKTAEEKAEREEISKKRKGADELKTLLTAADPIPGVIWSSWANDSHERVYLNSWQRALWGKQSNSQERKWYSVKLFIDAKTKEVCASYKGGSNKERDLISNAIRRVEEAISPILEGK